MPLGWLCPECVEKRRKAKAAAAAAAPSPSCGVLAQGALLEGDAGAAAPARPMTPLDPAAVIAELAARDKAAQAKAKAEANAALPPAEVGAESVGFAGVSGEVPADGAACQALAASASGPGCQDEAGPRTGRSMQSTRHQGTAGAGAGDLRMYPCPLGIGSRP